MKKTIVAAALAAVTVLTCALALADQLPPLSAFSRMPAVDQVSISPDGRYLAYLSGRDNRRAVIVADRRKESPPRIVLIRSEHDRFDITWCRWANETRLLCGLRASVMSYPNSGTTDRIQATDFFYPVTRLVAVNADGSEPRELLGDSYVSGSQFEDEVLDMTPADPRSVLIEVDDDNREYPFYDRRDYPFVGQLDVYTGKLSTHSPQYAPISGFVSDGAGNVRLGFGLVGKQMFYFARTANAKEWLRLAKFKVFTRAEEVVPLAVTPGSDDFYYQAPHEGRQAIWRADLKGEAQPTLVFSQPAADMGGAVFAAGKLIGFEFAGDRPGVAYLDARSKSVIEAADRLIPDRTNVIVDMTPDRKVFVIRSSSGANSDRYSILDASEGPAQLKFLGDAYPELEKYPAAVVEAIRYPARDGTAIPGYLARPANRQAAALPLVVLPHDGPWVRDSGEFSYLRNFLVSRGYAVLQMNFRGSSGLGWDWFHVAHQDWGGLTYDDIVDATRWVVAQKIADPQRICIAGWGFGGYAAQLGAVRNGDLFRCSISIAGISDLFEFKQMRRNFVNGDAVREQVGTSLQKLKQDSPLRQVKHVAVPVLLIHGDSDSSVDVSQTKLMAYALKQAGKPHEVIVIKNADHALRWESDRETLLTAIEAFLQKHIGSGNRAETSR